MVAKTVNRVESSTSSVATPKKAKMSKANLQDKPAHPKTADMVNAAIKELSDRTGSSLISIKKYIGEKYDLGADKKTAYLIRNYLRQAVANGSLVQTKGRGANGSFKMPSAAALAAQRREAKALKEASKKTKSKKPAAAKKTKITDAEKTSVVKKQPTKVAVKQSAADGKPKSAKSAATKTDSKSPKAKKITKAPTSKPKAPRPKKVTAASKSPKPAAKKVVAAKK